MLAWRMEAACSCMVHYTFPRSQILVTAYVVAGQSESFTNYRLSLTKGTFITNKELHS